MGITNSSQKDLSIETEAVAYIGIDWSDQKHDICIYDTALKTQEFLILENRPEVIHEWVEDLRKRYGGRRVAISLEQKRRPLIYILCK